MKIPNPFPFIGSLFASTEKEAVKIVKTVSPFVLSKVEPILVAADEQLWQNAWPLAVTIVKQLASQAVAGNGLDLHKTAVQQLEAALLATGKFVITEAIKAQLGQIVLSAFVTAVLAAV